MPSSLLLAARLTLAAVFAVAGLAKLFDRDRGAEAARGFGVPAALAAPVAVVLPLVELGIAAALLPAGSAPWAALGALALLAAFTGAIGVALLRGRAPDCRCFGRVHSSPVGPSTLARNAALLAVAGAVAVAGWNDPGPSAVAWVGDLDAGAATGLAGGLVAAAALAGTALLSLHLLRRHGALLLRIEELEDRLHDAGIPVHQEDEFGGLEVLAQGPAPGFALPGLDGETVTLDGLVAAGRPVVLVFADANCGPCEALMPEVARWQREHADRLTIAVVAGGGPDANREKADRHGVRAVLLESDRHVSDAYEVSGTPSAVLVDPSGWLVAGPVGGPEAVRALIGRALTIEAPDAGLAVGATLPEIQLELLHGGVARLDEFAGEDALLLFWNAGCGFCRRMREEVRAWEDRPPGSAPRLVIIGSGEVERLRAEEFRAPVLLDVDGAAGRAVGASGTPMGLLLGADGRIAAPIAAGRDQVARLAEASVALEASA